MRRRTLAGLLGLTLSLSALPLLAGENASAWLERMSAAMTQMTYQGTFIYILGDDVQTMRITHVAENGEVRERLVSISGANREVIRDASGVRWFSGGDRGVLSDPAVSRPIFFELPLNDAAQASDSYDFNLRGNERIAGHSARRLDIEPHDGFRYGYTLWLETQSGLLLQWQLNDRAGDTLARLMFTELKIGSEVNPEELRSPQASEDTAPLRAGLPSEGRASRGAPAWAPGKLPPGFRLASHRAPDHGAAQGFEHLVYSDGIAAVSVYIEAFEDQAHRLEGVRRMGTTHAYSNSVNGMYVTVVGDVPEATVRMIGEAVREVEP